MPPHICSNLVPAYRTLKTSLDLMESELSRFEAEGTDEAKAAFDVAYKEAHASLSAYVEQADTFVTYRNHRITSTDALVIEALEKRCGGREYQFTVTTQYKVDWLLLADLRLPDHLANVDLSIVAFLPNLLEFDCSKNGFKQPLSKLPNSLQILRCDTNQFETLPETLPDRLKKLYCNKNLLTILPELPPSLEELNCSYNRLTVLPKLPRNLIRLNCAFNQLTDLPDLHPSLTRIDASGNPLTEAAKAKLDQFEKDQKARGIQVVIFYDGKQTI